MICARASEDAGAGHLGETGFGSALFYTYICIDKDLLVENLGGDEALANQTLRAFTEAALKVSPNRQTEQLCQPCLRLPGAGRKKALNNHALWRRLSMNPLMAPSS